MHNLVKLLTVTFFAIILSGCSFGGVDVDISVEEYETDNECVYIEKAVISGLSDKEFEQKVNSSSDETINNVLKSFLENSQNSKEMRIGKAKLDVKQKVIYNKNSVISVIGECFEFTEGFNGKNTRIIKNINTQSNCELKLSDIFCDEKYVDMLNSRLEKMSQEAQYSDLWEKPTITDAQNEYFYFSDEGIVIFYPPYELSYYARGFVEFTISYDELYGYLKPEYSF